MRSTAVTTLLVLGVVFSVAPSNLAIGAPVPLTNAGFEDTELADGESTTNGLHFGPDRFDPGWYRDAPTSQYIVNPLPTVFPGGASEGENALQLARIALMLHPAGGLQENTVYTLQVDVGRGIGDRFEQLDIHPFLYRVGIALYDFRPIGPSEQFTLVESLDPIVPEAGSWETVTVQFVTPSASELESLFGSAWNSPSDNTLTIELEVRSTPFGPLSSVVYFDNVRLDATAVPEVGTLGLCGFAFVSATGLLLTQRRISSLRSNRDVARRIRPSRLGQNDQSIQAKL